MHVVTRKANFIQVTCDCEREELALRGEVMRGNIGVIYNNIDVINTAVISLVGVVCCSKQEIRRVIDSWLGVGVCCVGASEGEVEGASLVLWLDGAADGEVGTLQHLLPLLLALGNPVYGGEEGDGWLKQQIWNKTEVIG